MPFITKEGAGFATVSAAEYGLTYIPKSPVSIANCEKCIFLLNEDTKGFESVVDCKRN